MIQKKKKKKKKEERKKRTHTWHVNRARRKIALFQQEQDQVVICYLFEMLLNLFRNLVKDKHKDGFAA